MGMFYAVVLTSAYGAVAVLLVRILLDQSREAAELDKRVAERAQLNALIAAHEAEREQFEQFAAAIAAHEAEVSSNHPYRTSADDRRAAVIRDAVWMRDALARGNKVAVTYSLRGGIYSTRDIEEVLAACVVELTREST